MTPFFQILQGSTDVTQRAGPGNISLSLTDGVGINGDSGSFVIDDQDGRISPPKTGVELTVIAGYRERSRNFGTFIVDHVSLAGWPQTITVNMQSAAAKETLKQRRVGSFEKQSHSTYGDVFKEVAGRNGLELAISKEIGEKPLDYEAQAEENDSEFLTRIGNRINAAVSVKSKRLVVVKKGGGATAGGQALPPILVTRGVNLLSYSVDHVDKVKHAKVKAAYYDREENKRMEEGAPASAEGPEYLLRDPFRSKEEAKDAAESKASDIKRAEGSASFVISGDPFAMAEAYVIASGIRSLVDGVWRSTSVGHEWSATSDYQTTVECEKPG